MSKLTHKFSLSLSLSLSLSHAHTHQHTHYMYTYPCITSKFALEKKGGKNYLFGRETSLDLRRRARNAEILR